MVAIVDLLLPAAAAAVGIFVVSSLVHMVLAYHTNDFGRLPEEDRALDALRAAGVPPGNYRFPYAASMKEMGTPEMTAKVARGPVGYLQLFPPGPCSMGASLAQWFALSFVVALGSAWIASRSLAPGAGGGDVFLAAAAPSFLAFGCAPVTDSIWKRVPWSVCAKFVLDGALYAATTGAACAALWP